MEREASKEAVTLDRSYDRSDDRLLRVYQGISQSWESQWKCRALRDGQSAEQDAPQNDFRQRMARTQR